MACVSILTITVNQAHRVFLKITFLLNICIRCIQPYHSWNSSGYTMTFFWCILIVFGLGEISLRKLFTAEFHTNRRCLGLFTWVNPVRVWIKSCICTTMSLLALIVLLRHGKHNSVLYATVGLLLTVNCRRAFMCFWAYTRLFLHRCCQIGSKGLEICLALSQEVKYWFYARYLFTLSQPHP